MHRGPEWLTSPLHVQPQQGRTASTKLQLLPVVQCTTCRHHLPQCQQRGQHTSNRLKSSRFGLVAEVSASFASTGLSSMSYQGSTCTSETVSFCSATLVSPVAVRHTRRNAFQRTNQAFLAQDNVNQQIYRSGRLWRVTPILQKDYTAPRSIPLKELRRPDYDDLGMFCTTGANQACWRTRSACAGCCVCNLTELAQGNGYIDGVTGECRITLQRFRAYLKWG